MTENRDELNFRVGDLIEVPSSVFAIRLTRWQRFRRWLWRILGQEWKVGEATCGGRISDIDRLNTTITVSYAPPPSGPDTP